MTSGIQSQIDTKQATIDTSNRLDASLIHDGSISNTEFAGLDGLDSNIQGQPSIVLNQLTGLYYLLIKKVLLVDQRAFYAQNDNYLMGHFAHLA